MATAREWIRRLWGTLTGRRSDRDLERELQLHLELAEDELRRRGRSPGEAARLARVRLGGSAQVMENLRDQRGIPWLASSFLDLKLGFRLLVRSWGLTLVGGLAMTVVIAIGAVVFAAFEFLMWSEVPLDEGDRVVAIQTWNRPVHRRVDTPVADFERWRDGLQSVEDVGAFQTVRRNVITPDGAVELASIAEITASGFRLARVAPVLGRTLVEADEAESAQPVVVIGQEVWRTRFGSDPAVLGQPLRLGTVVHTVVGVMPEGFKFPFNHRYWTPLRIGEAEHLRDAGPEGVVFARLASGASLESAAAEVGAAGLLPAAVPAETDESIGPRLVSYPFAFTGDFDRGELGLVMSFATALLTLLLVPPCANIAILVYARTVTRQEEFAARYALGGSRGRIVSQLFIEMLLVSAGAAVVALGVVQIALTLLAERLQAIPGGPPFWMDLTVSYRTALLAGGLAVIAAAIAGLLPALQATRRLARSGAILPGRRVGMPLGPTWTTLIVAQVAFSIAALPSAAELAWGTLRPSLLGPGFASEQYLTARLLIDGDRFVMDAGETPRADYADAATKSRLGSRFADRTSQLVRTLEATAGVAGVSVSLQPPGKEPWAVVDIESTEDDVDLVSGRRGHQTRFNQIDDGFFRVFDVPVLSGRTFEAGEFAPGHTAAIVNRNFAEYIAPEGGVLGRRFRYASGIAGARLPAAEPGTWYEVVGVVENLPANTTNFTVYHPAAPGEVRPARLSVRMAAPSPTLPDRMRGMAAAVDPTLQVDEFATLDAVYRDNAFGDRLGSLTIGAVTLSLLLLSAAGLYSLMSFTVLQRRREIGIRSALGAQPGRLLAGIFRRALGQLAWGAAVGTVIAFLIGRYLPITLMGGLDIPGSVAWSATLMMLIGALAAVGPARRGLRVDPTEALRDG